MSTGDPLLDRIDDNGRRAPGRAVHHADGRTMTWGELVAWSDALAGAIASRAFPPEAPIVVRGHKQAEMLVGFLGCAKAGHPFVPIDASTPEARAQRIIAASRAPLVLTPGAVRALVDERATRPALPASAGRPMYVMYTSGSTGEPKGVVITRGNVEAFLDWMLAEQQFAVDEEVFLNQVLYSFDVSVMDTWTALVTGGSIASITSADLHDYGRLIALLEATPITTWVSAPGFAQLCLAEPRFTASLLPQLRRFLFCGDVLLPTTAAQLIERFPQASLWNTYGPTEATVATTSVRIDAALVARHPRLPIGRAMPGTTVRPEDANGHPVPDGERGELVIRGPNVSPGYLGRPDLTALVFGERDGVRSYRTGDWAEQRDGLLFFHGRIDNQVKVAGHRVELGDIETHLGVLPGVRAAVVIATERAGGAHALHGFVMRAASDSASDADAARTLRAQLGDALPAYMVPQRIHVVTEFPLTANGKIDRRALAERAHGPREAR